MRRIAFLAMIFGMFLLALLFNTNIKTVNGMKELGDLEINQKVKIQGKIVSEKNFGRNDKILILENDIELVCGCDGKYLGKNVKIRGLVEEYDGKKRVRVLRLAE